MPHPQARASDPSDIHAPARAVRLMRPPIWNMMDVINYIRSLIFHNPFANRKRRAPEDFENPMVSKLRRISTSQMSGSEDDWVSTTSSTSARRRSGLLDKRDWKHRASWLKENNSPINIEDDDDDDLVEIKKPVDSFEFLRKPAGHMSSTPNNNSQPLQNGDDDIAFVKYVGAPDEKQRSAKKQGFDYIKPATSNFWVQNGSNHLQNGSRRRDPTAPLFNSIKDIKSKMRFPPGRKVAGGTHSAALDQSFRLDEKRKYRELLMKAAPGSNKNLLNSFSEYTTPLSRLFPYNNSNLSRGKKLVELSRAAYKKSSVEVIDLTEVPKKVEGKNAVTVRLSTRDTIKKVLNDIDNDVVVVKDSDSEVEVLPTPPSPKSDFNIEKCNSLKTYVDRSEPAHDDWISNLIKQHHEKISRRQELIEEQKSQVQKHTSIGDELRTKLLNENVRKCLYIKDVLLPDEDKSNSVFLTLTPEQEAKVDGALDKSKAGGEILARQFNINITRQDMLTLAGLNWLNDEVINYYMNLIVERGKMERWPKAYAFNTFFYPKISSGGQPSVRRWTKKIDIFSYDIIAVPIHLRLHWCMALIDFRRKVITYYDSMGSSNKACLDNLLMYLEAEHEDKKKTQYETNDWRLISAKNIPQQMNGSDCGMFSCTFAEVLTRDGEINFSQEDMPYLRRKMVLEILESRLLIS